LKKFVKITLELYIAFVSVRIWSVLTDVIFMQESCGPWVVLMITSVWTNLIILAQLVYKVMRWCMMFVGSWYQEAWSSYCWHCGGLPSTKQVRWVVAEERTEAEGISG